MAQVVTSQRPVTSGAPAMAEREDESSSNNSGYTWQYYLFGMVVTSLIFTLIVQFLIGPGWGDRFFRGWVDPALNLVITPLAGAILGFFLVALGNIFAVRSQKKQKP